MMVENTSLVRTCAIVPVTVDVIVRRGGTPVALATVVLSTTVYEGEDTAVAVSRLHVTSGWKEIN